MIAVLGINVIGIAAVVIEVLSSKDKKNHIGSSTLSTKRDLFSLWI